MNKLTKLEAGKTYRLIDKEGYFSSFPTNVGMYSTHFKEDCVTLHSLSPHGAGDVDKKTVIGLDEIKHFELVDKKGL